MSTAATLPPSAFLPAPWPPRLYFGFAHACLFTAFALTALDPRGIGGFFDHPRMLAVVHLVTLGWISSSIMGSLYLVLPLAFRASMPAGGGDLVAFALWSIGVSGMVFHFWIDHPMGMAWAATMVLLVFIFMAARGIGALRGSPLPAHEKRPLALALTNILLAGTLGVLLGIDKFRPILPGAHLSAVLAHAHLAALGFATMMIVGTGYRLLPMALPAAMPKGAAVTASIVLLELGALGLFVTIGAIPWLVPMFALLVLLGIAAFFSRLVWMLRNRRPGPTGRARPDAGLTLWSLGVPWLAAGLAFDRPSLLASAAGALALATVASATNLRTAHQLA